MLLADIICQNITSEKTFQEAWMLISCLSCINRAVSRRGSDRPEGYAGKCILYERGLQGGLRALPASPTFRLPCASNHTGFGLLLGKKRAFCLASRGTARPQTGLQMLKGFPEHHTASAPEPGVPPVYKYLSMKACPHSPSGFTGGLRALGPAGPSPCGWRGP